MGIIAVRAPDVPAPFLGTATHFIKEAKYSERTTDTRAMGKAMHYEYMQQISRMMQKTSFAHAELSKIVGDREALSEDGVRTQLEAASGVLAPAYRELKAFLDFAEKPRDLLDQGTFEHYLQQDDLGQQKIIHNMCKNRQPTKDLAELTKMVRALMMYNWHGQSIPVVKAAFNVFEALAEEGIWLTVEPSPTPEVNPYATHVSAEPTAEQEEKLHEIGKLINEISNLTQAHETKRLIHNQLLGELQRKNGKTLTKNERKVKTEEQEKLAVELKSLREEVQERQDRIKQLETELLTATKPQEQLMSEEMQRLEEEIVQMRKEYRVKWICHNHLEDQHEAEVQANVMHGTLLPPHHQAKIEEREMIAKEMQQVDEEIKKKRDRIMVLQTELKIQEPALRFPAER